METDKWENNNNHNRHFEKQLICRGRQQVFLYWLIPASGNKVTRQLGQFQAKSESFICGDAAGYLGYRQLFLSSFQPFPPLSLVYYVFTHSNFCVNWIFPVSSIAFYGGFLLDSQSRWILEWIGGVLRGSGVLVAPGETRWSWGSGAYTE